MKDVVIAGYKRSPFTPAFKGEMADFRPEDIAAQTINALLKETNLDPDLIEDLIMGCAFPEGEQGLNVARNIVFISNLPLTTAGVTVNRFCGSSMQAIHIAAGNICSGMGDAFFAGGIESMSRVPMTGFNPLPHPGLYEAHPEAYEAMGITAENLAKKYKISRKEQDAFAVLSQDKTQRAVEAGHFDDEIVPIFEDGQTVDRDGCPRPGTDHSSLKSLKPAFLASGSVTAGTSSPLTDGASMTLICSRDFANEHTLEILASIRSFAVSGCAPEIMGIGPVGASKKALKRAGLSIDDIDIIELNEAFASQSLACISDLALPMEKINLDGGAIALGHPLGATGARIVGKAASLLNREEKQFALATQCIGGGQGIATILERDTDH